MPSRARTTRRGGGAASTAAAQGVEGGVLPAVLDSEHAAEVRATDKHEMDEKCHGHSGSANSTATSTSNGCEFENVPGGSVCMFTGSQVPPPGLDSCQCTDKNCHPNGGCTRRFHHSCGASLEQTDERFSSLSMKKCCPQCMYKICDITWGGMAAAASAPSASAGDDFMDSFHIDSEEESRLLNSGRSRAIEMETNAEVRGEMEEDAADAGVVPGGDGDGNALIVRGVGRQGLRKRA